MVHLAVRRAAGCVDALGKRFAGPTDGCVGSGGDSGRGPRADPCARGCCGPWPVGLGPRGAKRPRAASPPGVAGRSSEQRGDERGATVAPMPLREKPFPNSLGLTPVPYQRTGPHPLSPSHPRRGASTRVYVLRRRRCAPTNEGPDGPRRGCDGRRESPRTTGTSSGHRIGCGDSRPHGFGPGDAQLQ